MRQLGESHKARLRFTQDDFDEFARLSGDDNPIHVDPDFAARTKFGQTVAHGMMLFGFLDAATSAWIRGPVAIRAQDLIFPAPTFAGEDVVATLRAEETGNGEASIAQVLCRADGTESANGFTLVGRDESPLPSTDVPAPPEPSGELLGIRPGRHATATRTFTGGDVAAYRRLVGDTNPRHDAAIPAPLLGGIVSGLLGTKLPGRGTNWLRQRFRFHAPVPIGTAVTARIEVVRVRPDKALVDLVVTLSISGETVATGESLVLISDLESRG
jgi:acyl dehydratase